MDGSTTGSFGTPPAGRPRIRLLSGVDTGTPQTPRSRAEVFRAFVTQLRSTFADLWPERGALASELVERWNLQPWPECWELHPAFVEMLWRVKDWHDALENDQAEGGYRERAEWFGFVDTEVRAVVRQISGRSCRGEHVDPKTPTLSSP